MDAVTFLAGLLLLAISAVIATVIVLGIRWLIRAMDKEDG